MQVTTAILSAFLQLTAFVLFFVAVVRSRGIARVLLTCWVALSILTTVMTVFFAQVISDALGFLAFATLMAGVTGIGSILLGVTLVIGRPGYRTEPASPQPPSPPGSADGQYPRSVQAAGQYGSAAEPTRYQPESGNPQQWPVPDSNGAAGSWGSVNRR